MLQEMFVHPTKCQTNFDVTSPEPPVGPHESCKVAIRDGRRCCHQPASSGILIKQARAEHHGDDQRQLHHSMGQHRFGNRGGFCIVLHEVLPKRVY